MIAILMVLAVVGMPPAGAHHADAIYPTGFTPWQCSDGPARDNAFCQTDNAGVTWWAEGTIPAAAVTTINANLTQQYNVTDLNVGRDARGVYTGPSETDIIYQRHALAPQFAGFAWCDDAVDRVHCDQGYVGFNTNAAITAALICHETGHNVGLTHGAQAQPRHPNNEPAFGCMVTPVNGAALGEHNRVLINVTY